MSVAVAMAPRGRLRVWLAEGWRVNATLQPDWELRPQVLLTKPVRAFASDDYQDLAREVMRLSEGTAT